MLIYPVPSINGIAPKASQGYGGSHKGVDIMYRRESKGAPSLPTMSPNYYMPYNVPALALADGVVSRSDQLPKGWRVEIDHGDFSTKYFHMKNPRVRKGQKVKAGDPLAEISFAPNGYKLNHLHFEVLKNGNRVNPIAFLSRATVIEAPNQTGMFLKLGIVVVAGVLVSKYVFK